MSNDAEPGRARPGNPGVFAVAVVVVLGAAVGGFAMAGSGEPTADEVLDDAHERYESADTIAGSAVVTVGNGTVERSAEVTFALAENNRSRVAVTAANRTAVAGSNGSAGWIHLEEAGLTRVFPPPDHEAHGHDGNVSARAVANRTASVLGRMTDFGKRRADLLPDGGPENAGPGESLRSGNVGEYPWNGSDFRNPWNGSHDRNGSDLHSLAWAWTPENRSTERVGTETVDGTEAHLIEIEPAGDREDVLRVWIATDDATVLKTRLAGEGWTVTVRYTDVRFDVSLADSTFQPPGAAPAESTVVDSRDELQAVTAFDVPALPEEYAFTTGSTVVYGNVTVAIGEYTGPENATLAATTADRLPIDGASDADTNATTVELEGVNATVADTDRGVAVTWERNGVRTAVVVEGSRETATSLAESVIRSNG